MNVSVWDALDNVCRFEKMFDNMFDNIPPMAKAYLPYDIIKEDEGTYVLQLAVAGYTKDDLDVECKDGNIRVKGNKKDDKDTFIYKGISSKNFDFLFPFESIYEVDQVVLKDGLLRITIKRNDKLVKKLKILTK